MNNQLNTLKVTESDVKEFIQYVRKALPLLLKPITEKREHNFEIPITIKKNLVDKTNYLELPSEGNLFKEGYTIFLYDEHFDTAVFVSKNCNNVEQESYVMKLLEMFYK